MMNKTAIFSPCRKYRYSLSRIWKPERPYCLFVALNPSTADENIDDSTIRRCIRFSFDWGYGGMVMTNIFAYRSTDPAGLKIPDDPIGPENDSFIKKLSFSAGITVCAWGIHGNYLSRGKTVLSFLKDPHYLKLTKDGTPNHPLYLKANLKPKLYLSGKAVF